MSYFRVYDENENVTSFMLTSYEINKQKDNVIVKFSSLNANVVYQLTPDMRFSTVDDIKDYLDDLLETIITRGYMLNVYEDFARSYVKIGYETANEFEIGQFTALQL